MVFEARWEWYLKLGVNGIWSTVWMVFETRCEWYLKHGVNGISSALDGSMTILSAWHLSDWHFITLSSKLDVISISNVTLTARHI